MFATDCGFEAEAAERFAHVVIIRMVEVGGQGFGVFPEFVHLDEIGFDRICGEAVGDAARFFVPSGLLERNRGQHGRVPFGLIIETDRSFDGDESHNSPKSRAGSSGRSER